MKGFFCKKCSRKYYSAADENLICDSCGEVLVRMITVDDIRQTVAMIKARTRERPFYQRIQFYHPKDIDLVREIFGAKIESHDCVEKGIRFIKLVVFERSEFLSECERREFKGEEYAISVECDWGTEEK